MVTKVHNTETIKRILDDAGIQTAHDDVPQELASKIVPVLIANPKSRLQIARNVRNVTGAQTIFTTAVNKRTFLTGIYFGYMHDATADSTLIVMTATPRLRDSATNLFNIAKITLTAAQGNIFIPFNPPLELKANTIISMSHTFSVGAGSISALVEYFEMPDGS